LFRKSIYSRYLQLQTKGKEKMETSVSVHIDTENLHCGFACQWLDVFGVMSGSEDPKPRCNLCDRYLNEDAEGPLRCSDCLDMERRFHEEARMESMRLALQNKEGGIKLLEQTGYRVDISSFESLSEMLKYLIEREKIEPSLICSLVGITRKHLEDVIDGKEYPYLIQPFQQKLGVPRPRHITSDEEFARSRKLLHWSDSE
jgi:hypothetical protein